MAIDPLVVTHRCGHPATYDPAGIPPEKIAEALRRLRAVRCPLCAASREQEMRRHWRKKGSA